MAELFTNEATTTLSTGVTATATSMAVVSGAAFASPSGGDYQVVRVSEPRTGHTGAGSHEYVKITARSGNTLTVTRAQAGTSGVAWDTGATVEHVITADTLTGLAKRKNNDDLTLTAAGDILGEITVQDDGTSTTGWPDRFIGWFRNLAGTITNKVIWLNEYLELRLSPAKVDTTPLRLFTKSSASAAAHSPTSPIFEMQDDPDTGTRLLAVFPDGSLQATNVSSKVVYVASGDPTPTGQPDGTVVIELS